MNYSLEELEAEQLKSIRSHLENELETAYAPKTIKKGFKLSPLQISQMNFEIDELTASVKDKKQTYQIRMVMPFFEENGYSYTSCTCQELSIDLEENRCHHMWLAQHQFLKTVAAELSGREISSPIWQQMSSLLEPLLEEPSDPGHKSSEKAVFWVLDEDFVCSPILAKVRDASDWEYQKTLSYTEFIKNEQHWQNTPYKGIAARVGQHLLKSKGNEFFDLTFDILYELSEANRMLFDSNHEAIEIKKNPLSLAFRVEEEGLSWSFNNLDKASDTIRVFPQGICIYKKSNQLIYLIEMPFEGLFDFCNFLVTNINKLVDMKDVSPILAHLSKLQLQLAIKFFSSSFSLTSTKASRYTYLRITPLAQGGVIVQCFKCPLGSYSKDKLYLEPGQGPAILWNTDDYKSIKYVQRDLNQELLESNKLISFLRLNAHPAIGPNCYEIKDDLLAIELIDRLNELKDKQNIIIEWPADTEQKKYEIIEPSEEQTITLEVSEKNDWFFLKGGLRLNGEYLTLEDLLKAIAQKKNYIKLQHGKWLKISQCLKERLNALDSFYDASSTDKLPILRPSPGTVEDWEMIKQHEFLSIDSTPDWDQRLSAMKKASTSEPEVPSSFTGNLRSYQKTGFNWLVTLSEWGVGGVLADDMGLGKTVQTICFLLHRAQRGASLILCPSSVTENWKRELSRFAPDFEVFDLRNERKLSQNIIKPNTLFVCSYGLLLSQAEQLAKISWNAVVLDEAQICKNPTSKTYKSAKALKSDIRIALSGTPIENNLQDLWAIFSLVHPALLGPWQQFKEEWIKEKEDNKDKKELGQIIAPFLLRRLKQDYLSELPPKTEKFLQLSLSREERKLYDQIRTEAVALLTANKDDSSDSENSQEFNSVRIKLLSYLTRLRQLCSHPVLIEADWPNASSKMELFKEKALHLLKAGHKVLVFSQFPSFLKLLQGSMEEYGARCLYLDGTTPSSERSRNIDLFQNDEADFFFISLKAGGTGINLTKADYVFHMDPWWNPAVQAQATDRAYRMGQKNPVTIYRFICRHTVEETMTSLHKRKTDLATEVLSDQDQGTLRFDADYFGKLLAPEGSKQVSLQ
ncbi:MAG: DEAD/DEAH box helicase [Oligoflexales bacterium]|nr:DEAD/DEAH box helicase [Oligoflexales bacterium]